MEGHLAHRNRYHIYPKVVFQNKWMENTKAGGWFVHHNLICH